MSKCGQVRSAYVACVMDGLGPFYATSMPSWSKNYVHGKTCRFTELGFFIL